MRTSKKETEARAFERKLFDRMKGQKLTGTLTFQEYGVPICWRISDYKIEIGQDYIGISKKVWGIFFPITHWHPVDGEIFEEICSIGTRGNVTVIHNGWFAQSVLYMGSREDCPYKRKWLFGKYHYIYAE